MSPNTRRSASIHDHDTRLNRTRVISSIPDNEDLSDVATTQSDTLSAHTSQDYFASPASDFQSSTYRRPLKMTTDAATTGRQLPKLTNVLDYFKWRSDSEKILMQKGPDIYDAIMLEMPIPPPNTDEYREWRRYDLSARGILLACMSDEFSNLVADCKTAHNIWTHLEKSFSVTLKHRVEEIETEFNSLHQDKMTISMYVTKIATLAEQLKLAGTDISWHKRYTILMKGLRNEYHSIRIQIQASYRERRIPQAVLIHNPDGSTAPATFVNTPTTEKFEYDDIVDQLKAEEIRRGLHVFGLGQRPRQTVSSFYTKGQPERKPHGRFQRSNGPKRPHPYSGSQAPKREPERREPERERRPRQDDSRRAQASSRRPIEEVTCHKCEQKGHYANRCPNKRKEKPTESSYITGLVNPETVLSTNDSGYDKSTQWILDSASTIHVCTNRDLFTTFVDGAAAPVQSGSLECVQAGGKGTVRVIANIGNGETHTLILNDVFYVPTYAANLISLNRVAKSANIVIHAGGLTATSGSDVVFTGTTRRMLTYLDQPPPEFVAVTNTTADAIWHRRLGHPGPARMREISKVIPDVAKELTTTKCDTCEVTKSHKQPFGSRTTFTSEPLELVHSDVVGKATFATPEGFLYAVHFIDDYTRFVATYLMHRKSEVFHHFQTYKAMMENQTGKKIKRFRSDNGGEYVSRNFDNFLANAGIRHETTAPYTPEQNGVAERLNRTLGNITRSLLTEGKCPQAMWGNALLHATYLNNRLPSKSLHMKSPFQQFLKRNPDISKVRVFGCRAWAHIPAENRYKYEVRAVPAIYLGVTNGSKAFKLLDPATQTILNSYHATFNEKLFPFTDVATEEAPSLSDKPTSATMDLEVPEATFEAPDEEQVPTVVASSTTPVQNGSDTPSITSEPLRLPLPDIDIDTPTAPTAVPPYLTDEERAQGLSTPPLPPSTSITQPEDNLVLTTSAQDEFTDAACADEGIKAPPSNDEPNTIQQAQRRADWPKWKEAIQKELDSHAENNTWTPVNAPNDANLIGSRWVFKIKRKGDGSIDKYKARLVAQGFTQVHGIDYEETFAPVVKMSTLRMLLIMSLQCQMTVYQLDVVTAYLNGELDVDLYMRPPPLPDSMSASLGIKRHQVCRLNKSLYGLKQAGRTWYHKADKTLLDIGFRRSSYDSALYYINNKDGPPTILTLYVDDVLIFSRSKATADRVIETLRSKFKMTGGERVSFILGIQVNHGPGTMHLSQTANVDRLIAQFGLENANHVYTPLMTNDLTEGDKLSQEDHTRYRTIIGSILYIATCTRPDIAFAVNKLSRHLEAPTHTAMVAAKHLLRYLKGTANYGLTFSDHGVKSPMSADWGTLLYTFSDADFGGDTATRRSTSGIANTILGMPYSWLSKRQPLVATSTCFAEYVAMAEACKEVVWSRWLLAELGFPMKRPTPLLVDNQAAISLSKDPKDHQRNKHIDIKYHFIREKQLQGTVVAKHVGTTEQLADSFTKALDKKKVQLHQEKLHIGVFNSP